jgi:hypothetical protein
MTPRDTLAADLATLLPGCAVTADGPARIRIDIPGDAEPRYVAVSRDGTRVDARANAESRAPQNDRHNFRPHTADEVVDSILARATPKTVNGRIDPDSLRLLLSGPAGRSVRERLTMTSRDYDGDRLRSAVDAARLAERAAIKAATVAEQALAAHEARRAELRALLENA